MGVMPASTISSASQCSKYPTIRPGGPVSVAKPILTPASASFFRFRIAITKLFLLICCSGSFAWVSRIEVRSPCCTDSGTLRVKKGSSSHFGESAYANVDCSRVSVGA